MSSHHQPKGSMCMSCSNASPDCAKLPFNTMAPLKTYPDDTQAVKCTNHAPTQPEPPPLCIGCGARHHQLPDSGGLPCGH